MCYKLLFALMLYFDTKLGVVILALVNPLSMIAFDIWQFWRMRRQNRMLFDKLYFAAHLLVDLMLVINGVCVKYMEQASTTPASAAQELPVINGYYRVYRVFLICFVLTKFVLFVIEIAIFRCRYKRILKS